MPAASGEEFYEWLVDSLDKIIGKRCGRSMGFCLLVFAPEQTAGTSDYVANVSKLGLPGIMRATADSIESGKKAKNQATQRVKPEVDEVDNDERVKPEVDSDERVKSG